jgi:hypothetical protein
VTGVTDGTLTLNSDGSFTYIPDLNFNGIDSFTYIANDGLLDSNTATVHITVNPVNDAPEAFDDSYNVDEDNTLSVSTPGILSNDIDVEDDPLTAILVTGVTDGTLTLNSDGSFTYIPDLNFNGIDSFTYKVNNGLLDSNIATVRITVNPVNDAPIVNAGLDQIAHEGSLMNFFGTFSDPDLGDTHIVEWDFGDGSPSVLGTLTPTHIYADNGVYTVSLTVKDDNSGIDTDILIITVNNIAPIVNIDSIEQAQSFDLDNLIFVINDPIIFTGIATDPGSDDLTFVWDWGDGSDVTESFYPNSLLTYPVEIEETINHRYTSYGDFSVTLTVMDDDGGFGTFSILITILSAQDLKQDVISDLKAAKTGEKCIDKRIDHVIKFVKKSLSDKFWIDELHINPNHAHLVYIFEMIAVKYMLKFPSSPIFTDCINKLVKADEILARVIIIKAMNTPVLRPEFQDHYDRCITRAQNEIEKAASHVENKEVCKAIMHYLIAWEYAQFAIKWANKKNHCRHRWWFIFDVMEYHCKK